MQKCMAFLFYTHLQLPLLKKLITMSTIARLPNGSIQLVQGETTQLLCTLTNVRLNYDDANIKVISISDKQTIIDLVYDDLTEINGSATPNTIAAAAELIAEEVILTTP